MEQTIYWKTAVGEVQNEFTLEHNKQDTNISLKLNKKFKSNRAPDLQSCKGANNWNTKVIKIELDHLNWHHTGTQISLTEQARGSRRGSRNQRGERWDNGVQDTNLASGAWCCSSLRRGVEDGEEQQHVDARDDQQWVLTEFSSKGSLGKSSSIIGEEVESLNCDAKRLKILYE